MFSSLARNFAKTVAGVGAGGVAISEAHAQATVHLEAAELCPYSVIQQRRAESTTIDGTESKHASASSTIADDWELAPLPTPLDEKKNDDRNIEENKKSSTRTQPSNISVATSVAVLSPPPNSNQNPSFVPYPLSSATAVASVASGQLPLATSHRLLPLIDLASSVPHLQLQLHEIQAATDSVRNHPEILNQILPGVSLSHVPQDIQSQLFDRVVEVLASDSNFLSRTRRDIEDRRNDLASQDITAEGSGGRGVHAWPSNSVKEDMTHSYLSIGRCLFAESTTVSEWNALVEQHKCAICQDVLAAPVLTECSHSFCGTCFDSFTKIESPDHHHVACPSCRIVLDSSTGVFERNLDEAIEMKVDSIADCEAKRDYKARRETYIASKLGGKFGKSKKNEDEESANMRRFFDIAVPVVAVIVFVLIVLCRRF